MSSNSITGLATQSSIKAYVDSVATGLDVKKSCLVATTAITLTGVKTIDGISVTADQRVLVKNQTTAFQKMVFIFVR